LIAGVDESYIQQSLCYPLSDEMKNPNCHTTTKSQEGDECEVLSTISESTSS
jgi:hypothetical protein